MSQIATVGSDIPPDLMAATRRYAGVLAWNIDRPFPRAVQWLESKFPPWAFSILEDWASGVFDHLDAVVFSRGDDSAHRLYYYICELRRRGVIAGPEPMVFDVARIGRPTSEDHSIASVRQLAAQLGVSDAALEHGIRETNAKRVAKSDQAPATASTCLLVGTPPPDRRLHTLIEKAGWFAVGATLHDHWQRLGAKVDEQTGDPAAAIGRSIHAEKASPRAFYDRSAAVLADVQAHDARAVVMWFTEEDEAQIWHLPAQRKALEASHIPALVLTRCDWRGTDGVDTKIAMFLKDLAR